MIRKYTVNQNWKPFSRRHQFHKAFKNGMYGFKGGHNGFKISKVRFLRHMRSVQMSHRGHYQFGGNNGW